MTWNSAARFIYFSQKRIGISIRSIYQAFAKPSSFLKGDDFESCVRKYVYQDSQYKLINKTHDFFSNKKDFVEASIYPDFLFQNRTTNEEFWVEAKYRESLQDNKIEWCKYYQLARYREIQESEGRKVFIVIGFGGRAKNPEKIYLIPLDDIKYTGLFPGSITKYQYTGKRKGIVERSKDKFYDFKKST